MDPAADAAAEDLALCCCAADPAAFAVAEQPSSKTSSTSGRAPAGSREAISHALATAQCARIAIALKPAAARSSISCTPATNSSRGACACSNTRGQRREEERAGQGRYSNIVGQQAVQRVGQVLIRASRARKQGSREALGAAQLSFLTTKGAYHAASRLPRPTACLTFCSRLSFWPDCCPVSPTACEVLVPCADGARAAGVGEAWGARSATRVGGARTAWRHAAHLVPTHRLCGGTVLLLRVVPALRGLGPAVGHVVLGGCERSSSRRARVRVTVVRRVAWREAHCPPWQRNGEAVAARTTKQAGPLACCVHSHVTASSTRWVACCTASSTRCPTCCAVSLALSMPDMAIALLGVCVDLRASGGGKRAPPVSDVGWALQRWCLQQRQCMESWAQARTSPVYGFVWGCAVRLGSSGRK